ncbi:hypothetical protein PCE1_000628 [Barthelona sp. PCE]
MQLFLLYLCITCALCTTFYVDSVHGNDQYQGTVDKPFRSLSHSINVCKSHISCKLLLVPNRDERYPFTGLPDEPEKLENLTISSTTTKLPEICAADSTVTFISPIHLKLELLNIMDSIHFTVMSLECHFISTTKRLTAAKYENVASTSYDLIFNACTVRTLIANNFSSVYYLDLTVTETLGGRSNKTLIENGRIESLYITVFDEVTIIRSNFSGSIIYSNSFYLDTIRSMSFYMSGLKVDAKAFIVDSVLHKLSANVYDCHFQRVCFQNVSLSSSAVIMEDSFFRPRSMVNISAVFITMTNLTLLPCEKMSHSFLYLLNMPREWSLSDMSVRSHHCLSLTAPATSTHPTIRNILFDGAYCEMPLLIVTSEQPAFQVIVENVTIVDSTLKAHLVCIHDIGLSANIIMRGLTVTDSIFGGSYYTVFTDSHFERVQMLNIIQGISPVPDKYQVGILSTFERRVENVSFNDCIAKKYDSNGDLFIPDNYDTFVLLVIPQTTHLGLTMQIIDVQFENCLNFSGVVAGNLRDTDKDTFPHLIMFYRVNIHHCHCGVAPIIFTKTLNVALTFKSVNASHNSGYWSGFMCGYNAIVEAMRDIDNYPDQRSLSVTHSTSQFGAGVFFCKETLEFNSDYSILADNRGVLGGVFHSIEFIFHTHSRDDKHLVTSIDRNIGYRGGSVFAEVANFDLKSPLCFANNTDDFSVSVLVIGLVKFEGDANLILFNRTGLIFFRASRFQFGRKFPMPNNRRWCERIYRQNSKPLVRSGDFKCPWSHVYEYYPFDMHPLRMRYFAPMVPSELEIYVKNDSIGGMMNFNTLDLENFYPYKSNELFPITYYADALPLIIWQNPSGLLKLNMPPGSDATFGSTLQLSMRHENVTQMMKVKIPYCNAGYEMIDTKDGLMCDECESGTVQIHRNSSDDKCVSLNNGWKPVQIAMFTSDKYTVPVGHYLQEKDDNVQLFKCPRPQWCPGGMVHSGNTGLNFTHLRDANPLTCDASLPDNGCGRLGYGDFCSHCNVEFIDHGVVHGVVREAQFGNCVWCLPLGWTAVVAVVHVGLLILVLLFMKHGYKWEFLFKNLAEDETQYDLFVLYKIIFRQVFFFAPFFIFLIQNRSVYMVESSNVIDSKLSVFSPIATLQCLLTTLAPNMFNFLRSPCSFLSNFFIDNLLLLIIYSPHISSLWKTLCNHPLKKAHGKTAAVKFQQNILALAPYLLAHNIGALSPVDMKSTLSPNSLFDNSRRMWLDPRRKIYSSDLLRVNSMAVWILFNFCFFLVYMIRNFKSNCRCSMVDQNILALGLKPKFMWFEGVNVFIRTVLQVYMLFYGSSSLYLQIVYLSVYIISLISLKPHALPWISILSVRFALLTILTLCSAAMVLINNVAAILCGVITVIVLWKTQLKNKVDGITDSVYKGSGALLIDDF